MKMLRRRIKTLMVAGSVAMTQGADHTHGGHASLGVTTVEDTGSEIIITTAPVDLPLPAAGDGSHETHGSVFPDLGHVTIPVEGYLYGFDYEVVDGDGNILPKQIVHHFNLIDPDRRELFLPIAHRVLAAGQETGNQRMPWLLFGAPVHQGQRLTVSSMLHNPTDRAYRDISLRIKLPYSKVGRPWPFFEVYPFQLDVAFPVGDKSFDVPMGLSSKSWEGSPSLDGRILILGSHLHELATHITLEDVTDGDVLWTGYPVQGDSGDLNGVTIGHVWRRLGIKVSKDHVYRATVHYDNDTGVDLPGSGMGVVGGLFLPGSGVSWPRADPTDALYEADRRHFMRENG
jgi:hypothetical protein